MKTLTKLEKFGLIAAIIVVGTYFYMGKIYDPQAGSLKKTVKTLNKIIGEINGIEEVKPAAAIKKTIQKRRKELDELKNSQGKAVRKTGNESEITVLLDEINRLIESKDLLICEITPMGDGNSDAQGLFDNWATFDISLTGGYYAVLEFIRSLKGLQDAVIINDLAIEKKDGQKDLTISMKLMI